jgi:uncharacterized protein
MGDISRRNFFKNSALLAAALTVPNHFKLSGKTPEDKPKIMKYKQLGKTGFMVSDISSGGSFSDSAIARYLLECGINYFDSAYQYPGNEKAIGEIITPWRDKVFITTKWDPPLITPTVTKGELMEALDKSLERLNTNYIDCMMLHSIGNPNYGGIERIQNPAIYEAFDEAKKLKKIRFTGASSHGPNLIKEMEWCVDSGRFDLITTGMNFLTSGLIPLLKKAKSKGIGTIGMKVMTQAKINKKYKQFINQETNIRQAIIKWTLAQEYIDTIILSMRNYEQVGEYLSVSGSLAMNENEKKLLKEYGETISPDYCRPGCDGCLKSCLKNIPVWDINRFLMYFENYGNEKMAMDKYNAIPEKYNAGNCIDCNAPCGNSCHYGLKIREKMIYAHSILANDKKAIV